MEYFGNKEILNNYKIGFLCSRKVPANIILRTYDWAIEQRDKGSCIISGFHSKIEKDVFEILIKGKQPIILILARGMFKKIKPEIANLVDQNRLLIISPFDKKIVRPTNRTALKRNKLIAYLSDKLFIPYNVQDGLIDKLKKEYANKIIS
ncbi:MAG: DNA-binding protein [Ignavibacteriales bacterium UTCHB2]|jgi:predicted Rossmann fold nucleotide-binding protein DprA/Smf involved in DNA uptake|nr:MAG: DNA-binding protein [Ignavibacteriales bacterium UTCHB2]